MSSADVLRDAAGSVGTASPWLRELCPSGAFDLTVLALPHAGGSAEAFRPLAQRLPPNVRVMGVQYPGRGPRALDPLVSSPPEMIGPVRDAVKELIHGPLVVFGHSLGAVIGWEVTKELEAEGRPVERFVPAASQPPHLDNPAASILDVSDRDEFVSALRRLNGLPAEVLNDPDLLDYVLDIVRADFRLSRNYPLDAIGTLLTCPVVALAGTDDPVATPDIVARWAEATSGSCEVHTLDGGHFFPQEQATAVGRLIVDGLAIAS